MTLTCHDGARSGVTAVAPGARNWPAHPWQSIGTLARPVYGWGALILENGQGRRDYSQDRTAARRPWDSGAAPSARALSDELAKQPAKVRLVAEPAIKGNVRE